MQKGDVVVSYLLLICVKITKANEPKLATEN